MNLLKQLILLVALFVVFHFSVATGAQGSIKSAAERKNITIPVGVYILDGIGANDKLSSKRTISGLKSHFDQVNNIWSQADITIDPVAFERISVPQDLLWAIAHRTGRGGIAEFFRGVRRGEVEFKGPNNDALVWVFYVRTMGGPNGLTMLGTKTFFVVDDPTVDDARVTGHEIGHVLGLYHVRYNQRMLLFSGANGLILTEEEQEVARYNAKKILR